MKVILLLVAGMMGADSLCMAQKIAIEGKQLTMADIIAAANKQTGNHYRLIYDPALLKEIEPVTVNVQHASIKELLDACLAGKGFTYEIKYSTIILKRNTGSKVVAPGGADTTKPARRVLTGKIVDSAGIPMVNVSIQVKHSGRGVVSGPDGRFHIEAQPEEVLLISYTGFQAQEIQVGRQTDFNFILRRNNLEISTVVIAALGIKRNVRSLTYNVQELSGADVNTQKDGNFVNNLAGKVAGATINTSSTGIGASARVVLRGTKSIDNLKNNALYVVDGIPLINYNGAGDAPGIYGGANATEDGISQINPDDIATISVLTGPAAAALYGANAASGVILVTTKKATANATRVNVSTGTNFLSPFVLPQFQHTYGSDGSYFSWGSKLLTPSNYRPWDFFQTGLYNTNSLSVATGNAKNQTYFSLSDANGRGGIPGNNLGRINFTLKNNMSFLDDKLNVDLNALYIHESDQNMISQGLYNNPLVPVYLFPPGDDISKYQVFERYSAERNFKVQFWPYGDQGFAMQNPYWITQRTPQTHTTNRYVFNATVNYKVSKGITVTGRFRRDNAVIAGERKFNASTSGIFAGNDGYYSKSTTDQVQTYADILVNLTKKTGDFGMNIFLGGSYEDRQSQVYGYGGNLLSVPNQFIFTNIDITTATATQVFSHQQFQALYGTMQLSYRDALFIDVTGRNDWNSALAYTKTLSIPYPSVGVSGVLTDLLSIKSQTLSYLKARASYSEVGLPPNIYIARQTFPYASGVPATIADYPARSLQPERTRSWEAGFNTRMFGEVLSLDATAYRSSTFNQLFYASVPASTGYTGEYVNGGRIDNKGIEASLAINSRLGPVHWTSGVVFSLNRNKVVRLLDNYTDPLSGKVVSQTSLNMGGTTSYQQIVKEGGQTGDIYVNSLLTDEHGYIKVDPRTRAVTADDTAYIRAGNADPRYNLGWRNSFKWKDFSLQFLFDARLGGVGVSITQALMDRFGVSKASADARNAGGVMVNGGLIPAQGYYSVVGGGQTGIGSMYVYSATNVRLRQMALSYDVPARVFNNKIRGLSLSLTGQNLFMLYNKAPFDPESTASTGTFYQGIDYFRQPSYRSVGFNVSFQF